MIKGVCVTAARMERMVINVFDIGCYDHDVKSVILLVK